MTWISAIVIAAALGGVVANYCPRTLNDMSLWAERKGLSEAMSIAFSFGIFIASFEVAVGLYAAMVAVAPSA